MGPEEKILLDTNVIIRYITEDDPQKASRVDRLFRRAQETRMKLLISDLGVSEMVFVLDRFYQIERGTIVSAIKNLLATECIEFENRDRVLAMLTYYEVRVLDLVDAYHAAMAHELSGSRIYSYDRDFDSLEDIQRLEP